MVVDPLQTLVDAYRAGAPRAEARLAAEVRRRIYGILRANRATPAEADDFAQCATVKVMRAFSRKVIDAPGAYVRRAGQMASVDMGRTRKRDRREVPQDRPPDRPEAERVAEWHAEQTAARARAAAQAKIARLFDCPHLTATDRHVLAEVHLRGGSLNALADAELAARPTDRAGRARTWKQAREVVDKQIQRARARAASCLATWTAED